MSKYIVNNSPANVSLLNNTIALGIGGHKHITEAQATAQEVVDAVNRGWVNIFEEDEAATIPAAVPFEPKFEFENVKPQGSLTFPGAIVPPVVETPTVEPVVETPVVEEVVAKKGKKAAAQ